MNWLRQAVSDYKTQFVSSKRLAMVVATFALAISTIILAIAGFNGVEVGVSLASVAVPLAGLGGYSYVQGKAVESQREAEEKPNV